MIFKWMNESEISIEGDRIEITAPHQKPDFFCGSIRRMLKIGTVKNIRSGK